MNVSLFKSSGRGLSLAVLALALIALVVPGPVRAYPPAPAHRIFGLVRDEFGQPFADQGATIVFIATNGIRVAGSITPGLAPGVNYEVYLPMDAGMTRTPYKATALFASTPFRINVLANGVTYLPMEMAGNYALLGKPAGSTRIDLTLGVDANGDGLPDAWQQLLLDMLGAGTKVGPNDSALNDGVSNMSKYLAGVYAFDPTAGFKLAIKPRVGARPVVEFNAVSQHTYTLLSSTNMVDWEVLSFKIPANGAGDGPRKNYFTPGTQTLQIEPQHPDANPGVQHFYKVQVQ